MNTLHSEAVIFITGSFFDRLTLYYTTKKYFLLTFFSNFLNFFYTWRNLDDFDFIYVHMCAYILELPNQGNFTWN